MDRLAMLFRDTADVLDGKERGRKELSMHEIAKANTHKTALEIWDMLLSCNASVLVPGENVGYVLGGGNG